MIATANGTKAWHDCYCDGWQGLLVPEAFAHPAKVSKALADRIYQHAAEQGWLRPGDVVVDPFGGIGGTALWPALHGVAWCGCELELRFKELADQNFALWRRKWSHDPDWVEPRMVLGDSRRLVELVGAAGVCVGSPPFQEDNTAAQGYKREWIKQQMQAGRMRTTAKPENVKGDWAEQDGQGTTLGNLASLPAGEPPQVVVGSPPFNERTPGSVLQPGGRQGTRQGYKNAGANDSAADWGQTPGNLGNQQGDTFWAASRDILRQVYQLLPVGGHAIFVLKAFVRKGKLVDFPAQWEALCHEVGFRAVCRHHAMLVQESEPQHSLLGDGPKPKRKERKSFFRRLAERKGCPPIDYEVVLCTEV
jgi:hypothetical protein